MEESHDHSTELKISLQNVDEESGLDKPMIDPLTEKKHLKTTESNESIESLNPGDEEHKKKFMVGFDENRDKGEMICKVISKDFKLQSDDDQENISDLNAWTTMMPVHKQSKFGQ